MNQNDLHDIIIIIQNFNTHITCMVYFKVGTIYINNTYIYVCTSQLLLIQDTL